MKGPSTLSVCFSRTVPARVAEGRGRGVLDRLDDVERFLDRRVLRDLSLVESMKIERTPLSEAVTFVTQLLTSIADLADRH